MSKRNLFRELAQGIDEMRRFDQDKATLRTHPVAVRPMPYVDAARIVETRERLNVSVSSVIWRSCPKRA
jgi:putative transcriptional regulator